MRKQVHETDFVCNNCLKSYFESFEGMLPLNCDLSTDILLRDQSDEIEKLEQLEKDQWYALNDPIAWAKVELDWEPRWYQVEPLRCTAKRKVLRCGRQIGKSELLAILSLFYPATRANFRTVILCPYQDQVDLIFARIRKFVKRSETLRNPAFKSQDKMNPHEIKFDHPDGESSIFGMTTGARTGQKGDKYRGQTPSLLVVDEMDMLSDATMESVTASLTGAGPIAMLAISSTPTGRHGLFWKYCTRKHLGFKEFHFTAKVSPHWTDELEMLYMDTYSENGYAHEILAEFGEMEVGIFQHKYIDSSLRDYNLNSSDRTGNKIYTIGVDWNRGGIGVHIVIMEYDPATQVYKVVGKEIVDSGQFTQAAAVNRIIELNEKWDPAYIYVDQGDGQYQTEDLQLVGLGDKSTGLHKKVKAIKFGAKIEVIEPVNQEVVKKAVKPFMVELCARRVECGECIFPKSEDTDRGLVGQMRDYEVIRYGRDGQPIYTEENEHTLIAWMLSIYAVIIEFSPLTKTSYSVRVARTGPLGSPEVPALQDHKKKRDLRERAKRLQPTSRLLHPEVLSSKVSSVGAPTRRTSPFGGRALRKRLTPEAPYTDPPERRSWTSRRRRGDWNER